MSQVIVFKNNIVPGEADPMIVEELERLLEDAKRGDLRALGFCTVYADSKGTGWAGMAGTSDQLGMAMSMLSHRYTAQVLEGEQC